jgi:hypothetical protein
VKLLNVRKWAEVRAKGRGSFLKRMAFFGFVEGLLMSTPLWWGAWQFYAAGMDSLAKLTAFYALGLPPAVSLMQAVSGLAIWYVNEYLFFRYQARQTAA